ncbi:MAG: hypothetical protein M1832_002397 [Thelocarpon impressellum]|nr:MAG: hypothetical protein M1832_002397 [Thelocarpon impressellum]
MPDHRMVSATPRWDDGPHPRRLSPDDIIEQHEPGIMSSRGSLHTQHSLRTHRSHSSIRSRGGWTIAAGQRSPYAYAPRRGRGGYRSGSPSRSESETPQYLEDEAVERGQSFRAASPSSQYVRKGYGSLHRSDRSASQRPSGALMPSSGWRHQNQRISPPLPSSAALPSELGILNDVDHGHSMRSAVNSAPSRTPSPMYYDYSEPFEDQVYYSANASMASLPPLQHAKSFEGRRTFQNSSGMESFVDAQQTLTMSSPPSDDLPSQDGNHAPPGHLDVEDAGAVGLESPRSRQQPFGVADAASHVLQHSTSEKRRRPTEARGLPDPALLSGKAGQAAPHELGHPKQGSNGVTMGAQLHVSPRFLLASRLRKAISYDGSRLKIGANSMSAPKSVVPGLRRSDSSTDSSGTFDDLANRGALRIHAPKPERPLSSQNYKTRFGNIISVDQASTRGGEAFHTTGFGEEACHAEQDDLEDTVVPSSPDGAGSLGAWGLPDIVAQGLGRNAASDSSASMYSRGERATPAAADESPLTPTTQTFYGRTAAVTDEDEISSSLKRAEPAQALHGRSAPRPRSSSTDEAENAQLLRLKASFPWLMNDLPSFQGESTLRPRSPPKTTVSTRAASPTTSLAPKMPAEVEGDMSGPVAHSSRPSLGLSRIAQAAIPPKFKVKLRQHAVWRSLPSNPFADEDSASTHVSVDTGVLDPGALDRRRPEQPKKPRRYKLRSKQPSIGAHGPTRVRFFAQGQVDGDETLKSDEASMSGAQGAAESGLRTNLAWKMGMSSTGPFEHLSSHDEVGAPPMPRPETRGRPQKVSLMVPTRTVNPSEPRSFFSDDSSQIKQGPSLRKRISSLRSRFPAPKAMLSSAEDVGASDRVFGRASAGYRPSGVTVVSTGSGSVPLVEGASPAPRGLFRSWVAKARDKVAGVKKLVTGANESAETVVMHERHVFV